MSLLSFLKPLVEKIPSAAGYYRYLRDSKELNRDVVFRDKLGFCFNGMPSMEKGKFEPQVTAIVDSLLEAFDVFVNFGANTGYYVCKALHRGIPVVAFEPNQYNVTALLKNIDANKFEAEFHLFPIALSNQHGILPMYGALTGASLVEGWAGQSNRYLVPTSKFDCTAKSLVDNKSCLVLIDVEGAELNCLKGAETIINSSANNVFLIEITVEHNHPKGININPSLVETFNFMFSHGYMAFTADKDFRKIEITEVANVAATEINTFGTYNFLFSRHEIILDKVVFD